MALRKAAFAGSSSIEKGEPIFACERISNKRVSLGNARPLGRPADVERGERWIESYFSALTENQRVYLVP